MVGVKKHAWFAEYTWDGFTKFDGTHWTHYNTSNSGLPANYVTAIEIDQEGNLWIGTGNNYPFGNIDKGGGLVKFDGINWAVFDTSNSNLPSNDITSLLFDDHHNLWIGTEGGGLAILKNSDTIITHVDLSNQTQTFFPVGIVR